MRELLQRRDADVGDREVLKRPEPLEKAGRREAAVDALDGAVQRQGSSGGAVGLAVKSRFDGSLPNLIHSQTEKIQNPRFPSPRSEKTTDEKIRDMLQSRKYLKSDLFRLRLRDSRIDFVHGRKEMGKP